MSGDLHDDRRLYTPEEAAEELRLGRTTVFRLIKSGELESIKIGRRRLITADALRDLVDSPSAVAVSTPHKSVIVRGPTGARVAANIRYWRMRRGLTLVALSGRLGGVGRTLGQSGVVKIELGYRRVDVDDLVAFAAVLEVTTDELLTGENDWRTLTRWWVQPGEYDDAEVAE